MLGASLTKIRSLMVGRCGCGAGDTGLKVSKPPLFGGDYDSFSLPAIHFHDGDACSCLPIAVLYAWFKAFIDFVGELFLEVV